MSNELKGKTAVVTGASSGIGRAIAERLGAAGVNVYLAGRTRSAMEDSQRQIETSGGKATIVEMDVRDVKQMQDLIQKAARDTGRLDIMVNNAGVSYPNTIADGDPQEWRVMLETNVLALLVGCQTAIRVMRERKSEGHIVNISSIAAQRSESGVYGATKHAVNCISSTLRKELEEDAIRIVNVMPGAIATNFARNFDPSFVQGFVQAAGAQIEVKRGERLPDEIMEKLQPAMKQLLSSPEDVAEAVLFAVTQPPSVNIAEIVVRPPKQMAL
ncbi:MAG: SDR family oxidoreductase [Deltaproteobacteria bacterium]|nr:SDR family oxidoreductase [Deltaproteobacteria bacterium]